MDARLFAWALQLKREAIARCVEAVVGLGRANDWRSISSKAGRSAGVAGRMSGVMGVFESRTARVALYVNSNY